MNSTPPIPDGFILLARVIFQSEFMDKPALYFKLWVWMLCRANWKDRDKLRRGQLVTSIAEMQEAMSYKVGYRKVTPTKDEIRSAYEAFVKAAMITTAKTTRGMIVTVLNYDTYQNPKNYEAHSEAHDEGLAKPAVTPQDTEEGEEREKGEGKTLPSSGDEVPGAEPAVFLTKKKRKLTGKRLETFNLFWNAFDYKRGKAEAGDAWYEIPALTGSVVAVIIAAAKKEAMRRADLLASGKTPKMAQGWLTGRRWEDEAPAGSPASSAEARTRTVPTMTAKESAALQEVMATHGC